ncbi:MAG: amidase family protein [Thermodesulfobacteriota bacterium]|nr:amidase family protein [Thermodesulfobacteriota bacterium]
MDFIKKVLQTGLLIILISALICCGKQDSSSRFPQKIDPFLFKSAVELTDAIRRGEITSLDLLNRYLDSIERNNGSINAVVALDVDAARARAAEADQALARGQIWGPLHGLPMTVKDVFEVAGMPATSGDLKLKSYIPDRNAIAVQRLIDAGAIIFGKTNVPYHARDFQSFNKVYGTTNNPWDLTRTPGGSSGGSASALAAGFTSLELGSDLGGSVRFPAHYTGVFGHKTTFGIVPRYGHIPPIPGRVQPHQMSVIPLFVIGPLSRSAEDLALSLKILTTPGRSEKSGHSSELLPTRRKQFSDYRVAVWFTDSSPAAEIDADVLAPLQKTVGKLREAGLAVDEEARPDLQLWETVHLWREMRDELTAGSLPLSNGLVSRQKKQQSKWAEFFERYDVLLAPVALSVAFPHNHREPVINRRLDVNGKKKPYFDNLSWTAMAIVSGLPATVAPVGLSESGLPVGIQIIGAKFEDRTTIAFAMSLSDLVGGFKAPPGFLDQQR